MYQEVSYNTHKLEKIVPLYLEVLLHFENVL